MESLQQRSLFGFATITPSKAPVSSHKLPAGGGKRKPPLPRLSLGQGYGQKDVMADLLLTVRRLFWDVKRLGQSQKQQEDLLFLCQVEIQAKNGIDPRILLQHVLLRFVKKV